MTIITRHDGAPARPLTPMNVAPPVARLSPPPRLKACPDKRALDRFMPVHEALEHLQRRNQAQRPRDRAELLAVWASEDPGTYHRLPERAVTCLRSAAQLDAELRRTATRHEGKPRTLWTAQGASGRTDGDVAVLWIRHPNGTLTSQRFADPSVRALFNQVAHADDTGPGERWTAQTRSVYERFIRPHLHPSQEARILKVTGGGYTAIWSAVRDHPFTPGVREAVCLTTTHRVSHCPPDSSVYAPARYARFSAAQRTTRVQDDGTRVRLIVNGTVRDITYGRLPEHLSDRELDAVHAIGQERAARLTPGQQADLARLTSTLSGRRDDASVTLLATRRPELLSIPALLLYVRTLSDRDYRRFRTMSGSALTTLTTLCGPTTRATRRALHTPDALRFLSTLCASGLTNPDLNEQLLHAAPCGLAFRADCADYVRLIGPDRAARVILRALKEQDSAQDVMAKAAWKGDLDC